MTAIFRTAMALIALLAAGATAAEPPDTPALTKEQAMDIWRAEQLIVRTSPEWLHTMFDRFPVTALMTLHAGADDVEGFSRRHPDITVERVMGPLPLLVLSVPTREAMLELLRDIGVRHVAPDMELIPQIYQSLPMINPLPGGAGGAGTTIAILDTGLISTNTLVQSGRVVAFRTFNNCANAHKDAQDRDGHGTVVASIAGAAAPQAKLAILKIVDCNGKLNAQNAHAAQIWVYENAAQYNIVAAVMSYATNVKHTGTCSSDMADMLGHLLARDVLPVVAAGNSGWKTGLPAPACAPAALAVGMVYNYNPPTIYWGEWSEEAGYPYPTSPENASICIDTNPKKATVPCVSNSGNRLAMLAPGGRINVGVALPILQMKHEYGTSLAAPFVAGGVAVAQAIYKRSGSTILAAMKTHPGSLLIKDAGNNLSRPLIDITRLASDTIAARPPGYVPGPPGSTPGGSSPVAVATTTTAPVTLLTPPHAAIGDCSSCHGI